VDFAQAADADGFAEVDVAGYGGGAGVEPMMCQRGGFGRVRWLRGGWRSERGRGRYQSIDCGGSSFEGEVLTVSTQPFV